MPVYNNIYLRNHIICTINIYNHNYLSLTNFRVTSVVKATSHENLVFPFLSQAWIKLNGLGLG
jgi:hypothetical protein